MNRLNEFGTMPQIAHSFSIYSIVPPKRNVAQGVKNKGANSSSNHV